MLKSNGSQRRINSLTSSKYWDDVVNPNEPPFARANRLIGHFTTGFVQPLSTKLDSKFNLRRCYELIGSILTNSIPYVIMKFEDYSPGEGDEEPVQNEEKVDLESFFD